MKYLNVIIEMVLVIVACVLSYKMGALEFKYFLKNEFEKCLSEAWDSGYKTGVKKCQDITEEVFSKYHDEE